MVVVAACGSPWARQAVTTTVRAPQPTTTTADPTTTTAPPLPPSPPPKPTAIATTLPPTEAGGLQGVVNHFVAGRTPPYGIVVLDLKTGARATVNADRVMWSASLYKLYVAEEILRRLRDGALSRDTAAGDDDHRTVGDCLRLMIVVSSDDCGVALLRMIGREGHDAVLHREGFTGTFLGTPQRTTPADVERFFVRVYRGELVDAGASAELLQLLKDQQVNDRISLGVPAGTVIAHKTGDRIGWAHDAAIVYAPRNTYLLVVMSGVWPSPCCKPADPGQPPPPSFRTITDLSARIYAFFER